MMKKFILAIAVLIALSIASAPYTLGFSVLHLGHAIEVATHLSAKLACSAHYVTGLSKTQIVEDLASYSPAAKLVTINYDEHAKTTTVDLFGMAQTSASYHPAKGCSLSSANYENSDDVAIDLVVPPISLASQSNTWPVGNNVKTIHPGLQQSLEQLVAKDNDNGLNTRAMLIVKNGEIVAEAYSDGITASTPLLGWSMAKSVTAMLIGRMQQLNRVTMTQRNLFSEWSQDKRQQISLKDLLQMSSGLAFDETYAPGSDATHMLFTADSASSVALKSELNHNIGQQFSYSSGTTNLLSRFIHQQLGNSTQHDINFLYQELFQPLGIRHAVFETDASGIFVGSSYLYASGRDWARLGLLMLNNGKARQQQLLPKQWVTAAITTNNSDNDRRYGYQFWLNQGAAELRWPSLPKDAYAMMGNRQQSVMVIPSKQVVFVRLGWTKGDFPMEQHYHQLLQKLI